MYVSSVFASSVYAGADPAVVTPTSGVFLVMFSPAHIHGVIVDIGPYAAGRVVCFMYTRWIHVCFEQTVARVASYTKFLALH